MHNIQTPGGTSFNFNSDLSGDLHVVADNGSCIEFPISDLTSFLIQLRESGYLRREFKRGEGIPALSWLLAEVRVS